MYACQRLAGVHRITIPNARRWSIPIRCVSVRVEPSPNPASHLFFPEGKELFADDLRPMLFKDQAAAKASLLAGALLRVHGVEEVMLASRHVTVTKEKAAEWQDMIPTISLIVRQFFKSSLEPVNRAALDAARSQATEDALQQASESEVMQEIRSIIAERVSPMIEEDGGSVKLDRFDEDSGVVWLEMQGSCRDCPKSEVTLKTGILKLLSHYVPEVKDVREVGDLGTEDVPSMFKTGDRVVFWGGRPGVIEGFDEEGDALVKLDGVEEIVAASSNFIKHESAHKASSSASL